MVLYWTSSVLLTSERADPVGTEARGANQSYPPEIATVISPIVRSVIERR